MRDNTLVYQTNYDEVWHSNMKLIIIKNIGIYKRVIQGKQVNEFEIILMYIENEWTKVDEVERSLEISRSTLENI